MAMSMDVFRALANFTAENHASSALEMRKGELFEVIDHEEDRDSHDWWGVRRLEDNAVGFAPAKYLKFEQKMMRDSSPDRDDADDMDREAEAVPDLYKLPPMDVKPIDDWKPTDDGAGIVVPVPDYSDEEEEDDTISRDRKMKKSIKTRLDNLLTPDDWEKIVIAAEGDQDLDIPEPDYNDGGELANGSPRSPGGSPAKGSGGLVGPKKLPNPVLASKERQDLHRELLMNQKFGVDVLHRKSELKKEMDRRQDAVKKKEMQEYHRKKRSSFEEKLEEQANKLKLMDEPRPKTIPEELKPTKESEFMRVHSKISRSKSGNAS